MAAEAFSDDKTAAYLNGNFICISLKTAGFKAGERT
jgi:uncharacterized protein YyaL (SSP411 family)